MKKTRRSLRFLAPALVGLAAFGSLGLLLASAESTAGSAQRPQTNRYIGAKKCKSCHSSEETGDQYGIWSEMKHARAHEVLATDEAIALAKEQGIDEPQKADACLKCHVTAHGAPQNEIARGFKPELGVQCESCHGPGEKHMKARFAAAGKKDDGPVEIAEGELVKPTQETCLQCHNDESPSFEKFCFYEMVAKVRHLKPGHSDEELAAMLVCGCGDCGCKNGCEEGQCAVPASDKK